MNKLETYEVELPNPEGNFSSITFQRRFQLLPDYTVVHVNTDKFIECFERDHMCIPPLKEWASARLESVRKNLGPQPNLLPPELPIIGLQKGNVTVYPPFWGFFGLKGKRVTVPIIAFVNGRHRTRYLQHAGVKQFPVEVHVSQAAELKEICGM